MQKNIITDAWVHAKGFISVSLASARLRSSQVMGFHQTVEKFYINDAIGDQMTEDLVIFICGKHCIDQLFYQVSITICFGSVLNVPCTRFGIRQ